MSIDLKKLENKLDETLSNETSETLNKFLTDKTMSNNKNLTREELISVAEKLYKHMNPETKRDTPSMVYEIVVDKWYPEFQKSETLLDFFNWCLLNKQAK